MTRVARILASLVFSLLPAITFAGGMDVSVEKPWSRASIGTARPGVAYLTLHNNGDTPVVLHAIKTPVAMKAMVHRTTTDASGASKMAPAGDIEIAPGQSVSLAPGGLHAMLMKLKQPLKEGDSFPLTLVFADGTELTVEVPVLSMAARGPEG